MRIADILRNKGNSIVTIDAHATVNALLCDLARHNIGAMVVLDNDAVVGIISERDVVRRLHERGPELLSTEVSDVMTALMFTCVPADSVDSIAAIMTERRIRHVPVIENGSLLGIVSIGDVVKSRIDELQSERDQLESYIDQG
ncbi:histidine kinase [Rhodococcus sp. SRB_17]|uniref:CBS domain-containing protein n=1 Tax=Rhodococcus sp. OK302 TaxID=1882769 RepID=UPI000B93F0BE|nr:CBS domain-containing protein [Rhodococcus sp. OK302]NMM85254.1 histidine kinase [Rhodococcus sp. SRB_17]OYD69509.1 CBS domain protein [Rhodococcus sp. OK302]